VPRAAAGAKESAGVCLFWAQDGRTCDRGVNCKFWHDPSIPQANAADAEEVLMGSLYTVNS